MTKLSGSKVAWPIYGSIGNISSHVRRRPSQHAMVLIGYLPVAKLNWISNATERREERWKLYHSTLAMILEPLRAAARTGVEMVCADVGVRRVHPILSTHLGDWPEMCLFGTCRKNGCPVCVAEPNQIEVLEPAARLRTNPEVLSAFRYTQQGYAGMQAGLGLRPGWPYWSLHPWASGPGMIVPDLLHQLWKGVFLDQIRPWWTKLISSPEMDQRFASIPRYSTLQHFRSGLAGIAQWTGNEAKAIAKSFLAAVAGDAPEMGVEAARSVMDFTFRARQPQLDEDDLACLERVNREFHATREIFITRGAYTGEDFNDFSKMHMMGHYTHQIREWGAPDGYNTEGPERLHIEKTTRNQSRIELLIQPGRKWTRHQWNIQPRERHAYQPEPRISIATEPTLSIVTPATILEQYNAPDFLNALRIYLEIHHVDLAKIITQEPSFGVYHKLKLIHPPLPFDPRSGARVELVRASPARLNNHGLVRRDPFFDTVLIEHDRFASGLQRYCPARVLVIFQLHRRLLKQHPQIMAYVELFEECSSQVPEQHGLPVTKPLYLGHQRVRLVIPITDIRLSYHMLPDYAALRREFPGRRWDASTDVLSLTRRLFLNRHVNYFFFSLMDHWRRISNYHQLNCR
ncbi:Zn-finger protein, putative [Rhizoctonia solani AG-3 Rhs1AP]|uniref:Zn-finger protein, putative n=1 Tax=Rhizoctonia solani AG-3 Rhs1AP TaxID=1086054 RepID=X8IZ90_9AGAM|nr:Zn-finger protein, putative [Rhizoctonia solani AG-3 Rhs1AP]